MNTLSGLRFDGVHACSALENLSDGELNDLDFGVIGFDLDTVVKRYNAYKSQGAGVLPTRVLGLALFTALAPCMNNLLVAQRFEDATATGLALDLQLDYVFTLRMQPTKVTLRLVALPAIAMRYVPINRRL